jgi:hypothetical protein
MRFKRHLCVSAVVVGAILMFASSALASTKHMSAPAAVQHVKSALCSGACWTHLGGDPLFPGGLIGISQRQHISLRQAFVYALTSSRGQTAMAYAGVKKAERKALNHAARTGNFQSCTMTYGELFPGMAYGIHGTSVDRNVIFADPNYRNGAPAFCASATVHGYTVTIKLPEKCANVGLKSRVKKAVKKATHKFANFFIRKIAEDDQGHQLPATPTGTFVFQPTVGSKSYQVVYNNSPQLGGRCTIGKSVTVKELTPLGSDKWTMLTPESQTITCKKGLTFVFKDQETAPAAPTAPSCVNGSVNQNGNNNVIGCGTCIGNNVCNTTPPIVVTPCNCAPPVVVVPPPAFALITKWTTLNDVVVPSNGTGASKQFCVDFNGSGAGHLAFNAGNGSFSEQSSWDTPAGTGEKCTTYVASQEAGVTQDTITITYTVAGANPATQQVNFKIEHEGDPGNIRP